MTGESASVRSVLVVTFEVPTPEARHAGGVAVHRQVESLRGRCDLTVLAPYGDPPGDLSNGCRVVIVRPEARGTARRLLDYAAFCLTGLTPGSPVARALHRPEGLPREARARDVVVIHYDDLAPLVPDVRAASPEAAIAVIAYEVVTQSMRRRARGGLTRRDRLEARARLIRAPRRERRYLDSVDLVVTFSDKDADLLRDLGIHTPIHVLPPTLQVPEVVAPEEGRDHTRLVFVGAFGRSENVQGALWFLDEVWPLVLADQPSATLDIVGAGPPPALRLRAAGPVRVTGEVPTIGPYYDRAALAVAPLLTGAGVKFKIPQAMVHGLPVVTTSVGAEGLTGLVDEGMVVRDDPAGFACAVVALLRDPLARRRMGAAGRALVLVAFDQAAADRVLADRLLALVPRR